MISMCPTVRPPAACGCNAGAAYSLKWPYLRKRAFKWRFSASMAAKTRVLAIFGAKLAGNRGYNACVDRYGRKWAQGIEKQRPATGSCGPLIVHRAGLELGQVHITLLGQGLVEGKGFVKSVAGLSLLGNLEVVPHELLVVGVHAVLYYALGALGG